MISVIVVPQNREDLKLDILEGDVIYINKKLGEPQLENHNAKYIAPFFLEKGKVVRIYHIIGKNFETPEAFPYDIYLGNSFLVDWNKDANHRRFTYHALEEFGLREVEEGFLLPI